LQAANFIQAVEERQGLMISSPEEIAYRKGFIDHVQLKKLAGELGNNEYAKNLLRLAGEG
jgi:glucose-1-phosphate thymidylyltransferase